MEFLIIEVIKKLEEVAANGNAELNQERKSLALEPDKHNKEADQIRKKENSGCC